MSYPRPIEMSDSASKPRAWEARVGLGDDERRDLQRIEVLTEVLAGRRTVASAAAVLDVTVRQVGRLLIQIDGSQHRWFEDRGEPCTLLVFIDDATSRLMQLRFVPSESTSSYFEALQGYLQTHGCPVAFYSDKHSVFRMNRDATGGQGMTQFGRALAELNIRNPLRELSQAKGRVERASRTLQDRLVKELRLAGVSNVEAGNAFLPAFMERFNERFAVRSSRPDDIHHTLNVTAPRLTDILCHREQRYVGAQLTFHYDRKLVVLEPTDTLKALVGRYVELYEYADRPMEVRSKGVSLPYRIFSKDQRVSHTAVVENKRLGHALSLVKAQQDTKRETKVLTNSEQTGYKKNPRAVYGPDYVEKTRSRAAVEMTV